MTFFALVRNSPMVLINSRTRSSPSAAIFSGVSASANKAGVALLTPASVACADSTTATSSVNGLMCCSSPLGSGIATWKRRNASSISALLQGLVAPCSALASAFSRALAGFTLAAWPLRAFFTALMVFLAVLPRGKGFFLPTRLVVWVVVWVVVFLAIFALYLVQHDRTKSVRQRPRSRAHAFFGDHHAASLAERYRVSHRHGAGL